MTDPRPLALFSMNSQLSPIVMVPFCCEPKTPPVGALLPMNVTLLMLLIVPLFVPIAPPVLEA